MRVPRRHMEKARIEIIPMIDIIFFLLVFFIVSTLSMTINHGLPVNLPKAASSQQDLRETFNVTVMQDGRFVEHGPVRSVLRSPKHPYTKSLLNELLDDAPPRSKRAVLGEVRS